MAELQKVALRLFGSSAVLPRGYTAVGLTMNSPMARKPLSVCRHLGACVSHSQTTVPVNRSGGGRAHPYQTSTLLTQSTAASLLRHPHRVYSTGPTSDSDGSHSNRMMPFEEYRKLKKTLKIRARISGLPMALVSILASSAINVHLNPNLLAPLPEDEIQLVLGMDPINFAILCGVGSGIVGYLVGGALFNATWKLLGRQKARQLKERDADFLKRIQRNRSPNFNRFHDDYYGDKVMTLSDYRQWVRQQQEAARWDRLRQKEGETGEAKSTENLDSETTKL